MAKNLESIRTTEGNGRVIRLFHTVFLDIKWADKIEKGWLVVEYDSKLDKYIPDFDLEKNIFWDDETYNSLKEVASFDSDKKNSRKPEKLDQARKKIMKANKQLFWFDSYEEADDFFVKQAIKVCGIDLLKTRWI